MPIHTSTASLDVAAREAEGERDGHQPPSGSQYDRWEATVRETAASHGKGVGMRVDWTRGKGKRAKVYAATVEGVNPFFYDDPDPQVYVRIDGDTARHTARLSELRPGAAVTPIQDPVAMAEARDGVLASLIGRAPWTDEGDAQFARWAQDPAAADASASLPAALGWTHDTPTESGWYWYSDGAYGPAPVYLLRRRSRTPGTIAMRVDQVAVREGMGQDQDLLGVLASDLPGGWRPLAERAPEGYSTEEDAPQ